MRGLHVRADLRRSCNVGDDGLRSIRSAIWGTPRRKPLLRFSCTSPGEHGRGMDVGAARADAATSWIAEGRRRGGRGLAVRVTVRMPDCGGGAIAAPPTECGDPCGGWHCRGQGASSLSSLVSVSCVSLSSPDRWPVGEARSPLAARSNRATATALVQPRDLQGSGCCSNRRCSAHACGLHCLVARHSWRHRCFNQAHLPGAGH